jgi:hypothetical protein
VKTRKIAQFAAGKKRIPAPFTTLALSLAQSLSKLTLSLCGIYRLSTNPGHQVCYALNGVT